MASMARKPQRAPDDDGDNLSISVSGDRATVARIIAGMAGILGGAGR